MSTGKRLAKRSILGTRVVAPGDDGRLYPGIIADMKTPEGGNSSTSNTSNHIRYTVRFDENRKIKDFIEGEIIGPGFSAVTSSKLRPKQKVWVTNANREMEGYVLHHRPNKIYGAIAHRKSMCTMRTRKTITERSTQVTRRKFSMHRNFLEQLSIFMFHVL